MGPKQTPVLLLPQQYRRQLLGGVSYSVTVRSRPVLPSRLREKDEDTLSLNVPRKSGRQVLLRDTAIHYSSRQFLRFRCKSTRRKGKLDSTNTGQHCPSRFTLTLSH